jgi:hypothetical protein
VPEKEPEPSWVTARKNQETDMKTLFISIALAAALALWGAQPQASIDSVMAAGHVAGEQVYNIVR